MVAGLLRSHAEIQRWLHQQAAMTDEASVPRSDRQPGDLRIRPGTRWPRERGFDSHDIVGLTPSGATVAIALRELHDDLLLAFLSSGCLTCAGFWDTFGSPERLGLPGRTRVVIVTRGPEDESVARIRELAPAGITVVMSSNAWARYGVPGAPYFILVDGSQVVVAGEGTASSWEQVRTLIRHATDDRPSRCSPS